VNKLFTEVKSVTLTRRLEGIDGAGTIKELETGLFLVFQNTKQKCFKLINDYPVTQTLCFKS